MTDRTFGFSEFGVWVKAQIANLVADIDNKAASDDVYSKAASDNKYLTKVEATRCAVAEVITLQANTGVDFILEDLVGEDHANFDLLGANIIVKALDNDVASPTHECYINSEFTVVTGVNELGVAKVFNQSSETVELYVRIDVNLKLQ